MKSFLVRIVAQWIADDLPMPAWMRYRLSRFPEIRDEITRLGTMSDQLRHDARNWIQQADVSPRENLVAHPDTETKRDDSWQLASERQPNHVRFAFLAAALLLLSITIWFWEQRPQEMPSEPDLVAESIDTRPIFASLNAGQEVARRIGNGLETVRRQVANSATVVGSDINPLKRLGSQDSYQSDGLSSSLGTLKTALSEMLRSTESQK